MDLINKDRDDGFVFRPVRVRSVIQQESVRLRGAFFYYLDLDVIETDCSVLSGKLWKECTNDIPVHEAVFGHCKAIAFMSRTLRIQKVLNYNCTLGNVPSSQIVRLCPDCPVQVTNITPDIKSKAKRLVEQFNKDSNETHHFKMDDIERVRTQHMFGPSYFFYFTIKETECLKTQTNVNLEDCKSLKDSEAHVGFCKGSTYNTQDHKEGLSVSCEIYNPRDDDDHRHGHCGHGSGSSKPQQGQEKAADETKVQQEGTGEPGQDKPEAGKCEHHGHGHCPHHRGHKHHRCRHGHHHHHSHPHPHHHHHHHDHDHQSDSHPHDPSHHDHHHDQHNHTSDDGNSSEEHSDNKPFEKSSRGSVETHYNQDSVPVPTIVRLPPPADRPGKDGKHGKPDNIEFPSGHSHPNTCPGEPLVTLPQMIQDILFA